VDFKSGYNIIDINELWRIMREFKFPTKLIRLVRATMNDVISHERIQNEVSKPFGSINGLRQGDASTTILFNIVLRGVMRRAEI
jgi:hypothetical protein